MVFEITTKKMNHVGEIYYPQKIAIRKEQTWKRSFYGFVLYYKLSYKRHFLKTK